MLWLAEDLLREEACEVEEDLWGELEVGGLSVVVLIYHDWFEREGWFGETDDAEAEVDGDEEDFDDGEFVWAIVECEGEGMEAEEEEEEVEEE